MYIKITMFLCAIHTCAYTMQSHNHQPIPLTNTAYLNTWIADGMRMLGPIMNTCVVTVSSDATHYYARIVTIKRTQCTNQIITNQAQQQHASLISFLMIAPRFFTLPYGAQKGCILHELYHLKQYCPVFGVCITIDAQKYRKGYEQEADAWALEHLACAQCEREYTQLCSSTDRYYLSKSEAQALIDKHDQNARCTYHTHIKIVA